MNYQAMPANYRIAYFAHTLRSDWNNGNAHFLRGLVRALHAEGHDVTAYEPASEWSIDHLRTEPRGEDSLAKFMETYSEFDLQTYEPEESEQLWIERLRGTQVVVLHEWNPPALAQMLLRIRDHIGYKLIFHDTHHRASSSPEQMQQFGLSRFDGVLAFGAALAAIYRERFDIQNVWTFHEAADTTVFKPSPREGFDNDVVWIGNWGEGERAAELREFLLRPAAVLSPERRFQVYGVRYPEQGLTALQASHIAYGGYLPNLEAPAVYARSRLTLHVPRQQYSAVMMGIPTIRVFEALACGIPLISAPWQDTEQLFRPGDLRFVANGEEMTQAIAELLQDPEQAKEEALRGLETVLSRHTCIHRAQEFTAICHQLLHKQESPA
jgi:spore maturation protein CgeB